ncbi:MAG: dihydropteroate synthase [Gammaproteobacteria bacterium]|jgi:dihydropteroate synthase|nr:dihydropteroate synthase [Gammaproteobacteria bacterium]
MKKPALIMGVLNVTPDSFSDGGQFTQKEIAIHRAIEMVNQGADIIDIGGESTRPGASEVSLEEELLRTIPIIESLRQKIKQKISIDTSKPEVMKAAIEAGASLVNDVNALQNPGALENVCDTQVDVCLMHMQGKPRTMQQNPKYKNVIDDIKDFFDQRILACKEYGIDESRIILDPGFGFGKTFEHNLEIMNRFSEFKSFGLRLLSGLSRKSMIGTMLNNADVSDRVIGSVTAAIITVQNGADIIRVHDVSETQDALDILSYTS